MKRDSIPTNEVLAWLAKNHPDLIDHAEIDRSWTWLAVDLRTKPEVRESLKQYGFVFAKRGHKMPSGSTGWWGHSCDAPMPFKRRDRDSKPKRKERTEPRPTASSRTGRYDPLNEAPAIQAPAHQAAGQVDQYSLG